eukprot:gene10253-8171_t
MQAIAGAGMTSRPVGLAQGFSSRARHGLPSSEYRISPTTLRLVFAKSSEVDSSSAPSTSAPVPTEPAEASRKAVVTRRPVGRRIRPPSHSSRVVARKASAGTRLTMTPRVKAALAARDEDEDDAEEEEDADEGEGQEASTLSPYKQKLAAGVRRALADVELVDELRELMISATTRYAKSKPDPEMLIDQVKEALSTAGSSGKDKGEPLLKQVVSFSTIMGVEASEVMSMMLVTPMVIRMPEKPLRKRLSELEEIIGVDAKKAAKLAAQTPALLILPKAKLTETLEKLMLVTGLGAERAALMMTTSI